MTDPKSFLNTELLSVLDDETTALEKRSTALDAPLGRTSSLLEFVQQAFTQVFRSELGIEITGFTQNSKEEAVFLEERIEDPVVDALLDSYVDLCNMWPDVLSPYYGGSPTDFLEFRTEFLPVLLYELRQLAEKRGWEVGAAKLRAAEERYERAIETMIPANALDDK